MLPQFLLLQLFLLEVLHLYFNVLYLQVLPQFLLCPFSACTVVRFNYCFLLNLNCEKSGRLFVKCTGGKCLRRILFEVSHNFHLLVEKFAIVPPTEIVFDQLWEFGPTGLWLWSCVVCCLWCVVFVLVLLAQINPIGRCRSPIQLHAVGGCLKVSNSSSIHERKFNLASLKEDFAPFSQQFLSRSERAG